MPNYFQLKNGKFTKFLSKSFPRDSLLQISRYQIVLKPPIRKLKSKILDFVEPITSVTRWPHYLLTIWPLITVIRCGKFANDSYIFVAKHLINTQCFSSILIILLDFATSGLTADYITKRHNIFKFFKAALKDVAFAP